MLAQGRRQASGHSPRSSESSRCDSESSAAEGEEEEEESAQEQALEPWHVMARLGAAGHNGGRGGDAQVQSPEPGVFG